MTEEAISRRKQNALCTCDSQNASHFAHNRFRDEFAIHQTSRHVCDKKQITQRINPVLDSTRMNDATGSRKRRTFQSTDSRTRVNLSQPRRHLPRRPSDQLAPLPLKNLTAADGRRSGGSDSNKPSCSQR